MSLARYLLAGVAACALTITPALAGPAPPTIHLAVAEDSLRMKVGSALHAKTSAVDPNHPHLTETVTFSGSLSFSAHHNISILVWATAFIDSSTCKEPNQSLTLPRKTEAAKIKIGTVTGSVSGCPGVTFTFYGPLYDLKKDIPTDAFQGTLVAKHFIGYHVALVANTDLTITP